MANGDSASSQARSNWLTAGATVGHLVVGLAALLGTGAGFLLSFSERLTRVEERQQAVIARNIEQDRATFDLKQRIETDESRREGLADRITQLEVRDRMEHGEILNAIRRKPDR